MYTLNSIINYSLYKRNQPKFISWSARHPKNIYTHSWWIIIFHTCFPFINQVMCGAGCAFDVVQFDTKFSPIVNWRLLNVIFGGPVCWTKTLQKKRFKLENIWIYLINIFKMLIKLNQMNFIWISIFKIEIFQFLPMTCTCSTFDSFVKMGVSVDTSQ